ncbi:MAG: hypothetical protein ACTSWC_11060, partial [Promethearchaeota archaeon]
IFLILNNHQTVVFRRLTLIIYELNYMTQEQWIIEEHQRRDQELLDQQYENAIMRKVVNQSLLISKKNARAYSG